MSVNKLKKICDCPLGVIVPEVSEKQKLSSETRIEFRQTVATAIRADPVFNMPACTRCVKAGIEYVVQPKISLSCAWCVANSAPGCDCFMSLNECKFFWFVVSLVFSNFPVGRINVELERIRRERAELDRRQNELEEKRRVMVSRTLDSMMYWEIAEGVSDMPPGFLL